MRIRSRTFIIALGQGAQKATTIISAVILVRLISKEAFGTYRQVMMVATFLLGLLGAHLPQSLYYFIPKLGRAGRRLVLSQTLLVALGAAGICGGVMFFAGGPIARWFDNDNLTGMFRIFWLFPFGFLALRLASPFMISLDRAVRAGVYMLVEAVLQMAPLVVLLALGFSLGTTLVGVVACMFLGAMIAVADMYRLSPGGRQRFDRGLAREQAGYVLPLMAATVLGVLSVQLDKVLIAVFFSPEEYAVYACGAIQIPVVGIVTGSVAAGIMPNMVTMATAGRTAQAVALWKRAASKVCLIVYPVFVICAVCAADIIVLMFTEAYAAARWPFLIYLFDLPIRVAVYGALLRALGRTRPIAVAAAVGLAVNASVSLALIYLGRGTLLAFLGPSVGTVIGFWAGAFYMLSKLRIATDAPFSALLPWRRLGAIMGLSVVAGLAALFVPVQSLNVVVRLLVRGSVFAVVLMGLLLLTKSLEPDEKEILRAPLRWLRSRLSRSKSGSGKQDHRRASPDETDDPGD